MSALDFLSTSDPYVAYSYSYPHKSAYGPLAPPVSLDEVWQQENRQSLFLYAHLPFCEMRCGFCNLFAQAGGDEHAINIYLDSVQRQASRMAKATQGDRTITRFALGGGTPTVLNVGQLDRLFRLLADYFQVDPAKIPTSVETSPKTASKDKLRLLRTWGIQRVSIGIQSFLEKEVHAIGRPQRSSEVHAALARIKALEFPILNIDLIYGQPDQTMGSWQESLEAALQYSPEEIFLYPLYVRPQTGLGRRDKHLDLHAVTTRELYSAGRDMLLNAGYQQRSMRCFTRESHQVESGPSYCCQSDAMVGLGAGARSYTSRLHYSSRFAVQAAGVRAILDQWVQRTEADFGFADWGIRLDDEEVQRRFVIQSLLHYAGLDRQYYAKTFGTLPDQRFPELRQLVEANLVEESRQVLRLTAEGIALSDAIGPSLYSGASRERLAEFVTS